MSSLLMSIHIAPDTVKTRTSGNYDICCKYMEHCFVWLWIPQYELRLWLTFLQVWWSNQQQQEEYANLYTIICHNFTVSKH